MGLFDFLRGGSSKPASSVSASTSAQDEARKLQRLIEALKSKDEGVLLSSEAVPKTISSGNQGLAAEAFAGCVQCESSLFMSSLLDGMFGGSPRATRLDDKAIQGIARQLISAGLSVNSNHNGEPLIYAAIAGNGSSKEFYVDALVDRGANLNVINNDGYSPLGAHLKSGGGSLKYRFESYMKKGARLNDKDLSDFEVYKTIFQCGLYEIGKTIPKAKLKQFANKTDEKTGLALLHFAAGGMQIGARGQDLQDMFKKDYLSNDGYPALVKLLLECGADPNLKTSTGYSPASIALNYGHSEVYNILDKQSSGGASKASRNINEPIGGMGTALFNACLLGDASEVKSLLAAGADPNARSFVNYPEDDLFRPGIPQQVGAFLYQQSMASMMNPSFFHHMEYGITNLYYPAMNGDANIVHMLLEAGADPNAICLNGLFPLYIAAEIGSLPVVRELVSHGADVNKTTPKGCTSILNAAEEGKIDVVRYLLDNGADPYIRSKAGQTAIDAAIKAGQMQVAQIMRNYR